MGRCSSFVRLRCCSLTVLATGAAPCTQVVFDLPDPSGGNPNNGGNNDDDDDTTSCKKNCKNQAYALL
jgi:hypothetical protein